MVSLTKYLKGLFNRFIYRFGTVTLLSMLGKGIVLDEPSVVAIKKTDGHDPL